MQVWSELQSTEHTQFEDVLIESVAQTPEQINISVGEENKNKKKKKCLIKLKISNKKRCKTRRALKIMRMKLLRGNNN